MYSQVHIREHVQIHVHVVVRWSLQAPRQGAPLPHLPASALRDKPVALACERHGQRPVGLGLELLQLAAPVHAEPERGHLARAITHLVMARCCFAGGDGPLFCAIARWLRNGVDKGLQNQVRKLTVHSHKTAGGNNDTQLAHGHGDRLLGIKPIHWGNRARRPAPADIEPTINRRSVDIRSAYCRCFADIQPHVLGRGSGFADNHPRCDDTCRRFSRADFAHTGAPSTFNGHSAAIQGCALHV